MQRQSRRTIGTTPAAALTVQRFNSPRAGSLSGGMAVPLRNRTLTPLGPGGQHKVS